MPEQKLILFTLLSTLLFSCNNAPKCHFDKEFTEEANAGCFIIDNNRALFVEGLNGKLSLPGGSKNAGEAPQCTAERETWEETGIHVVAKRKIYSFDNGFQLFDCDLLPSEKNDGSYRPWRLEIKDIHWLTADKFEKHQWRFYDQIEIYKRLLNSKK